MMELMLKSRAKQLKKNQKGFTLVELIVVVAILGILAVIGITRFAGLTDTARAKSDIATAASLASAAQVYIAQQPTTFTGTSIDITDLTGAELIDEPKDPQYKGTAWNIVYVPATKKLTVHDGTATNIWYPAPTEAQYKAY